MMLKLYHAEPPASSLKSLRFVAINPEGQVPVLDHDGHIVTHQPRVSHLHRPGPLNCWMDPVELGAFVVEGIRDNAPYILTHMEFRDEVRELYQMLDDAFPQNQQVPPGRGGFEDHRRAIVNQLRALPVKD
jgi:hypothetical protein